MTQNPPAVDANALPPDLLTKPDVRVETLENGLSLLVCREDSAPVVAVQFWVETGSIHEGRWLGSGISHLLEHLMFKGTPRRGNSEMARDIHDLGGRLNAYTSFDRTVYYTDVPVEGWVQAAEILGDAVNHSTLPEEEFEKEKEVIRREFAMGRDDPERELSKLLFGTVFTRHPYRLPVIGHLDLFNQLTREDVLAYYRERYSIENQTLIVVGPVDFEEARGHAQRLFGGIERRPLPDHVLPTEPPCQAPRFRRKEFPTKLTRLSQVYPVPGVAHHDVPALDVLAAILGDGRSSRLYQRIVEIEGLAEFIDAYVYAPSSVGVWGIDARLRPEREETVLAAIGEEIHRARQSEPTEEEIERAIRTGLMAELRSQQSMRGLAASFGRGWLTDRNPLLSHAYLQRLEMVTPAQIQAVAHRYLIESRRSTVVLAAEPEEMAAVPAPDAAAPSAYRKAEPLTFPHVTALKVAAAELPLLTLRLTLPSSLLHEPPELAGINRLASQLLRKGTKRRNAAQIARSVEQLGGRLQCDSGNNSATLGVELLASDAAVGAELLAEILLEFEPTENELATEKRKQLAALEAELDRPLQVAGAALREALYTGTAYAHSALGTAASIERISLDDIHRHLCEHAFHQGLVLTAAGDLAPEHRWRPALEGALTQLPPPPVEDAAARVIETALDGEMRVEKRMDKEQAVLAIAYPTVPVRDPDRLCLDLLDQALSDLGSRLFVRIREEMGLAYFVGTTQFLGRGAGYFCFYLGTDPGQREAVEAALREEIARLVKDGLTQPELDRARAKMLSALKFRTQNAAALAFAASLDELFGLGYVFSDRQAERLAQLSLAEVNAVAARYLGQPRQAVALVSPN
ncbi:MAG: pitrilysin family protein [Verrucomicrobiota bacterium]